MPVMRETAVDIIRHLQGAGHEAYLVGGCVRDELREVTPQDYDIATSAHPDEVEKLFPKTVGVGKQFGVMLVVEHGMNLKMVEQSGSRQLHRLVVPLLVLLTGTVTAIPKPGLRVLIKMLGIHSFQPPQRL